MKNLQMMNGTQRVADQTVSDMYGISHAGTDSTDG
jgi:hypothetical protein